MTKEIIIDGVNVAGCKHRSGCSTKCWIHNNSYWDSDCRMLVDNYGDCSNYPDCDYKELQREKQKNEKLRLDILKLKSQKKTADRRRNNAIEKKKVQENKNGELYKQINELKYKNNELEMFYFNASRECAGWLAKCVELEKVKQENEALKTREKQQHANIIKNNFHYHEIDSKNKTFKRALADIKEIVEEVIKELGDIDESIYISVDYINEEMTKILAKINEVCDG